MIAQSNVQGQRTKSVSMPGTSANQRMALPYISALDFNTGQPWTFSIWVKILQLTANSYLASNSSNGLGTGSGWFIYLDSSERVGLFVRDSAGGSYSIRCNFPAVINEWYHITVSYNGGTINASSSYRFTMNGRTSVSDAISTVGDTLNTALPVTSSAGWSFFGLSTSLMKCFVGGDMFFFNKQLSYSEIHKLMNVGDGRYLNNTSYRELRNNILSHIIWDTTNLVGSQYEVRDVRNNVVATSVGTGNIAVANDTIAAYPFMLNRIRPIQWKGLVNYVRESFDNSNNLLKTSADGSGAYAQSRMKCIGDGSAGFTIRGGGGAKHVYFVITDSATPGFNANTMSTNGNTSFGYGNPNFIVYHNGSMVYNFGGTTYVDVRVRVVVSGADILCYANGTLVWTVTGGATKFATNGWYIALMQHYKSDNAPYLIAANSHWLSGTLYENNLI